MSVQSTARYAGPFAGNGVTTVFAFGFKVFAASDIVVASTVTATGVVSNPVNGVDYTVQLNADQNANPGGTITYAVAPPATISPIVITSGIAKAQLSSFPNPGPWNPTTGESAWDKSMAIIQELGQAALLFAPGDVASTHILPSPAARAGKALFFDAAGVLAVGSLVGAMTTTVIGQIPFGAAANTLAQDSNLFWDNTNKRLGIGTSGPTVALDVLGAGKTSGVFTVGTNFQVFGDTAIFGSVGADSGTKILVRGTAQAIRIGTSAGSAGVEAVDNTGSASYQPLKINGSTVDIGIAGTPRISIAAGGAVTIPVSVVTPQVNSASGNLLLQGAAVLQFGGSGGVQWGVNGDMAPIADNTRSIGGPSTRVLQVYTGIIDSGTTGSLSLKTNNGAQQLRILHVGSTVTFIDVFGGTSGSPANVGASGEANTNLNVFSTGSGTVSILTGGGVQLGVLHTASVTRNITVTGSNGGNPTIGVTAGNLAITPQVVLNSVISINGAAGSPAASGGIRLPNAQAISWRNQADSGDIIGIATVTANSVNNIVELGTGSAGMKALARSGGAAPTTSDLSAGQWAVWRDTGGATTKLYYNNAGVIQSVALA